MSMLPSQLTNNNNIRASLTGFNYDLDTTNNWGFGGAVKTVYPLNNGMSIHVGRAYYRHLPYTAFVNLRNQNGSILAEGENNIIKYLNS